MIFLRRSRIFFFVCVCVCLKNLFFSWSILSGHNTLEIGSIFIFHKFTAGKKNGKFQKKTYQYILLVPGSLHNFERIQLSVRIPVKVVQVSSHFQFTKEMIQCMPLGFGFNLCTIVVA